LVSTSTYFLLCYPPWPTSCPPPNPWLVTSHLRLSPVGWSSRGTPATNSGFGNDPSYDAVYGGGEGVSMKTKAINLIGAVRTLMRRE
jgi:hypothetical protein